MLQVSRVAKVIDIFQKITSFTVTADFVVNKQTICCRKNKIDVGFSCAYPVIEDELCRNIIKVVCGSTVIASWIHSYFDHVMTRFMINNRTDA